MTFKRENCRNHYLSDTLIENTFIDEYMPDAPGDHVKVYLYAYMYSGLNQVMNNHMLAKRLNLPIEDVLAAWTYWEDEGIIRKYYPDPEDEIRYDVEFVNIRNVLYGGTSDRVNTERKRTPSLAGSLGDEDMAALYREIESLTGRLSDPATLEKIAAMVDIDGADPSIIAFAYRYCKENSKPLDFKYVSAVIKRWLENDLHTIKDVKEFIENCDNRFAEYKQIMKALGLSPAGITEEEKRTFNVWLDEMGFSLAFILEVCGKAAGMGHKFSYVKKVLLSEYEKQSTGSPQPAKPTLNDRQKYYEKIREDNRIKSENRRKEVYTNIPRIKEIDDELRALGMEMGKIMVSGASNKEEAINLTRRKTIEKQKEKEVLLKDSGYSADYMEEIHNCYQCKDTGILDNGGHCSCYQII